MKTQNPTVSLEINAAIGNMVLSAIHFPLDIDITPNKLNPDSEISIDELEIEFTDSDGQFDVVELGESLEKEIIQSVTDFNQGTIIRNELSKEEIEFLDYVSREVSIASSPVEIKKLIISDEGKKKLASLFTLKAFKFEVLWANLSIIDRPILELGSPIRISNISTRVQAKIQACVKLFGKWRCVRVTTPRIRIDARTIDIVLSSQCSVLFGRPVFSDVDLVITIRIFGLEFKIKIGLTKIINKDMQKRDPIKVIDLGGVEHKVPFSNATIVVTAIAATSLPSALGIEATFGIKQ